MARTVDKNVKKLGQRVHDGNFNSQSTVARIPRKLHKDLHTIKLFGGFSSIGEIIAIMLNGMSLKSGDDMQKIADALNLMKAEQQKLIKKKEHP